MKIGSNEEISTQFDESLTSYQCPSCKRDFSISGSNSRHLKFTKTGFEQIIFDQEIKLSKGGNFLSPLSGGMLHNTSSRSIPKIGDDQIHITGLDFILLNCPNKDCKKNIVFINSYGDSFPNYRGQVLPHKSLSPLPLSVPDSIRSDINEAELILNLSPKASATLSRRALQGMIRDFHNIKERSLHAEINKLKEELIISSDEHNALMSLKSIGNNGAHPNTDTTNQIIDIEEHEANDLISLIMYFIDDWYYKREKKNELFSRLTNADDV